MIRKTSASRVAQRHLEGRLNGTNPDMRRLATREYPEWVFVPRNNNVSSTPDYGKSDAALPRGED